MPLHIHQNATGTEPKISEKTSTDNIGSRRDHLGGVSSPKVAIAFVIDLQNPIHLSQRKKALEEVKNVCTSLNASFHHIQFEKLDFEESNVLETMYNADIVLIDLSIHNQKNTLFYHLGVREGFGMKENILTYNDYETDIAIKFSCTNYPVVTYLALECGSTVTTMTTQINKSNAAEKDVFFAQEIKRLLQNVEIQSKAHIKQQFLDDLKKIMKNLTGIELSKALHAMKNRFDDPNVISEEAVHNMLVSFRDIQDYDAMVNLVDKLEYKKSKNNYNGLDTPNIMRTYIFALNRRNKEDDRKKALKVITEALKKEEHHTSSDLFCLCGRIYKDTFVESNYIDKESLEQAIHWYRKGFEVQPNEYAGINLATLLVVSGKEFSESDELQKLGMMLNNFIGKKGMLSSLKIYWDVATFFEISVLTENFRKAIQAAECMFKLHPTNWCLKSTIGNITLIKQFQKQNNQEMNFEENVLDFWIEYFVEATKTDVRDTTRIPIVILEPSQAFIPSYATISVGAEQMIYLQITNVICSECLKSSCKRKYDQTFPANMIKSVSLYKRDDRSVFLYFHETADDFHMYFPNSQYREHFYNVVLKITK